MSECGQMGTMRMAGTFGKTTEASATAAYTVLPVGIEMMRRAVKNKWLITDIVQYNISVEMWKLKQKIKVGSDFFLKRKSHLQ